MNKRAYAMIFYTCSFLVLTLGFLFNTWHATNQIWFDNFQLDMESYVVGRLAIANQEGVFSKGGLTGIHQSSQDSINTNLYQYDIYEKGIELNPEKFISYDSQTGGQALTFSFLDKIIPISKSKKIPFFRFLTSVLTALLITCVLIWTFQNFGLSTAIITLILILFSQWMTVFGKNLWWSLWSFYLPFIALLRTLSNEMARQKKITYHRLFLIVFLSVLLKCFYTGFEYITTTLIMLCSPLIYYSIIGRWDVSNTLKRFGVIVAASVLSIMVSILLLVYQIASLKGSVTEGFKYIHSRFLIRTSGDGIENLDTITQNSLNSNLHEVLARYWHIGAAFDLNNLLSPRAQNSYFILDFGDLITIIFLFSFLLILPKMKSILKGNFKDTSVALVSTCLFSILAPLSWFVIFKAHSYIHLHMNFIVWYMPFALFGFVIIGLVITKVFIYIRRSKIKEIRVSFLRYALAGIIIAYIFNTQSDVTIFHFKINEVIKTSKYSSNSKGPFDIYIMNRELYFIRDTTINDNLKFFVNYTPFSDNSLLEENMHSFRYNRFLNKLPFWSDKNDWMIASIKLPAYKIKSIHSGGIDSNGQVWKVTIEKEDQILPTK